MSPHAEIAEIVPIYTRPIDPLLSEANNGPFSGEELVQVLVLLTEQLINRILTGVETRTVRSEWHVISGCRTRTLAYGWVFLSDQHVIITLQTKATVKT